MLIGIKNLPDRLLSARIRRFNPAAAFRLRGPPGIGMRRRRLLFLFVTVYVWAAVAPSRRLIMSARDHRERRSRPDPFESLAYSSAVARSGLLKGLCPRCGRPLVRLQLLRDRCISCGLDSQVHVATVPRLPPLILGTVVRSAITLDHAEPPLWLHMLIWIP